MENGFPPRFIDKDLKLAKRPREHYPAWLVKGERKSVYSPVTEHLVNSGHSAPLEKSFKIIYKIRPNLSKGIRSRHLGIAEALAIQKLKPTLCIQKKYVQPLSLPWPS